MSEEPACLEGKCPIDPCPCPHFETCMKRKQMEAVVKTIADGSKPCEELLKGSELVRKAFEIVTELEELKKRIKYLNENNHVTD